MRVLVTGSREWTDSYRLTRALAEVHTRGDEDVTLVHGGAKGADFLAGEIARSWGWRVEVHPARWDEHGRGAGPIRNQEMVDAGADVCVAFFKEGEANRGTRDCATKAKVAGIPVKIVVGG